MSNPTNKSDLYTGLGIFFVLIGIGGCSALVKAKININYDSRGKAAVTNQVEIVK